MNKRKTILTIILIILIGTITYTIYYLNDYYHAEEPIQEYLKGTENTTIIKTNNGLLLDGPGTKNALIFYPGAKVEYTSYLPLLMNLSNNGIDCFLVEMPYNIAFLGKNSANSIINNKTYNYTNYFISGHSLGGVTAASYTHENTEKIAGIILLASYSTEKIKNTPTLTIYGSNDQILNKENYENSKENLIENFQEHIIQGGNHAQYGFYGNQTGDGIATITRDKQIQETVQEIIQFINSISN